MVYSSQLWTFWTIMNNFKRHSISLTQLLLQQWASPWKLWHSVVLPLLTVQCVVWKVSVSAKASSIPLPLRYFPTQWMAAFAMWKPSITGNNFKNVKAASRKLLKLIGYISQFVQSSEHSIILCDWVWKIRQKSNLPYGQCPTRKKRLASGPSRNQSISITQVLAKMYDT